MTIKPRFDGDHYEDCRSKLKRDLEGLLMVHGADQKADTPANLLAEYMMRCLGAYESCVIKRDKLMGFNVEHAETGLKVRKQCEMCDEWYDPGKYSPDVQKHKHLEPQGGPARDAWIASGFEYEFWVAETEEGEAWAKSREFAKNEETPARG